jgi:hypothetical protein
LETARDLFEDLAAQLGSQGVTVQNIQRYDITTDQTETYFGGQPDFNLISGEGYLVKVGAYGSEEYGDYRIVGSHDPAYQVSLKKGGTGGSNSGMNFFAPPYHTVAATASELFVELAPANIQQIQRFDRKTDTTQVYFGGQPDFNLVRGEAYFVKVGADYDYVPTHY